MPNLYKQYAVRTEPNSRRVIDSNELVVKRLENLLAQQKKEQRKTAAASGENAAEDNGFSAGIVTEQTEFVEEIDPVAEAKKEAERILSEAREEAKEIVAKAKSEGESIKDGARASGYAEGKKEKDDELAGREADLKGKYEALEASLKEEYAGKMETMERDLVDVILQVFDRVFHIQFDNKKEILMYLIGDAILNIEGDKKFRVKVADGNVLFLENHKEEILERVGQDIEIEIVADSSLGGNDCTIETDSGVFDCSLGVQLENLIKDLKSLCR